MIHARYRCGPDVVEFTLEHDASGVRVLSYVGGAGAATAEQLDRWNGWLHSIKRFHNYQFACRSGGNELIDIRGSSASDDAQRVVVPVQWGNREIFLIPVVPGVNWD